MQLIRVVRGQPGPYHVSLDAVDEFERCILADDQTRPVSYNAGVTAASAYYRWQAREKLGVRGRAAKPSKSKFEDDGPLSVVVLMGANFRKCFPICTVPGRKSLYLFDAWPERHARLGRFIEDFEIRDVFVSASQARDAIAALAPEAGVHWLPEGIDPVEYRHGPPVSKNIDVLALGRRHDLYHERIVGALAQAGRSYFYESQKGKLVFDGREAFIDGLARSRISICVPSTVTHPDRAGGIETMTLRYLQSMVSKCLIVGHAPAEMVTLFGYNPVVEIDSRDPAGQLLGLLSNFEAQQELIECNHAAVLAGHTWHARWQDMRRTLLTQPLGSNL